MRKTLVRENRRLFLCRYKGTMKIRIFFEKRGIRNNFAKKEKAKYGYIEDIQ